IRPRITRPVPMSLRLPPEPVVWALSRHNAYLNNRPGGERLQRRGEDFGELKLDGAILDDAILPGCSFAGSSLQGAQFLRADLFSADFTRADLTGTLFDRADLRGANFLMAVLKKTSFRQADLRPGQILQHEKEGDEKPQTKPVDLSGANLEEANLGHAHLD